MKKSVLVGIILVAVIGCIILVSVLTMLYYFPGEKTHERYGTPYCTMNSSTSGTESGKIQVNVTWTIISPARPDIRWSDIPQSYAKVLRNGTVMAQTTNYTWQAWPTGTYVTAGDTITVTLNRTAVASGSIIKLILIYAPAGCTFSESSVTLNYTA